MPFIQLTTFIAAPAERVFDLSRSIELHKKSMSRYDEKPVKGKIAGLMEEGETVTWKARHLFKERFLTAKITSYKKPHFFSDEMTEGELKKFKHEHFFKPCENGTLMIDQLTFETPYGRLGQLVNSLFLTKYLRKLLEERNRFIKETAEGTHWKFYIPETTR